MIFFPILFFLIPAFFGISVLLSLKIFNEKMTVILAGSVGGIVFFSTLSFVFSIFTDYFFIFGISSLLALGITAVFLLTWKKNFLRWRELKCDRISFIIFFLSFVFFAVISSKLLIEKDDGIYTGIINAYGDVAWHVANITRFAESSFFPPHNPIFGGTSLHYPFLVNYFSSLLLRSGASIIQSVTFPAIIFIPILITLLYLFAKKISGKTSVGVLVTLLFIFGGATLGFTRLPEDFKESKKPLHEFFLRLPDRDYSGVGTDTKGYHFLNPVTTLLLPQRPILFGIPLALAILLLVLEAIERKEKKEPVFLIAGIIAGILPFIHAHSVLALIPAIVGLFVLSPSVSWSIFFFFALIAGFPEALYYISGVNQAGSFFRWDPGWMASENIVWYWLKNTGIFIPFIFLGFFSRASGILKIFAFAGAVIFGAANLWLFAPWAWDNYKLLVYWFLFSLPLVSWVCMRWYKKDSRALKVFVVFLIFFQATSAALDLWKIFLPTSPQWKEWERDGIETIHEAKKLIEKDEIVLTAPIHNSPMFLIGKLVYLGYPAHVWSHGGNPWDREKFAKEFYEGRSVTLAEVQPKYVLVGPNERAHYPALVIRPAWEKIFDKNGYQLYRLPQ